MITHPAMKRLVSIGALTCVVGALLTGCATSREVVDKPLEGTKWRLSQLNGAAVPAILASRPVDLQFDAAQHQVSGSSGVNRIAGSYQLAGKRLSLGPLISTRMAGTPEAMAFESAYLKALGRVDEWVVVDGKLELLAGPEAVAAYMPWPETVPKP